MAPDKTSRLLGNVNKELREGKTRSRNGGREHTPEERAALLLKRDALFKKRKDKAEAKRQKTIVPINDHTTLEHKRSNQHTTSEIDRVIAAMHNAPSSSSADPAMDQDMGTMAEDTWGWAARVSQPGGARLLR